MASHGSVRPSTCAKKTKTLETEHKHPYSTPEPAPNSALFFTTQMILAPEWIAGASVAGPGPTPPATTESRPPSADASAQGYASRIRTRFFTRLRGKKGWLLVCCFFNISSNFLCAKEWLPSGRSEWASGLRAPQIKKKFSKRGSAKSGPILPPLYNREHAMNQSG